MSWPSFSPGPLTLAPRVLMGCCDATASGLRALLSLSPPKGRRRELLGFSLDGLDLVKAAFSAADIPDTPLVVAQYYTSSNELEVTCIVLNAAVPDDQAATVVAALFRLLQGPLRCASFNGAPCPEGLGGLPANTSIPDAQLAALLHCLHASGIPALCLLTSGAKEPPHTQRPPYTRCRTLMEQYHCRPRA
ncbi:hypothetical protein WJX84_010641 [Apatococcus fuscideae]|uniref:Proteasome assembly chaperone 1 n=1 Tax=Apatococcus fuscideae TaxID=2026836 RepID=A0AAW1T2X2_9CHLO